MWKRRKLLLLLAWAAVGAIALALCCEREPSYGGKTLGQCLTQIDDPKAEDAIRHIGTNALPRLLQLIQQKPPRWRQRLGVLLDKVPNFCFKKFLRSTSRDLEKQIAAAPWAFTVLGAQAAPAIPKLARIANNPADHYAANCAVDCLGSIGPGALPQLLQIATNRLHPQRLGAIEKIGLLHQDAKAALPLLLPGLTDTNEWVRGVTSDAVFRIDRKALTNSPHY